MIIRAVRLKEFGCFSRAVAVEGFADGLNVLAAPNEDGKSTIFKAIQLVLTEKWNAGGDKIKRFIPYAGGAPAVELEVECDGSVFVLRKQFIKFKDGLVVDKLSGKIIAQKSEVEPWIEDVLGDRAGLGLVWAGQKASLTAESPTNAEAGVLRSLIEGEVELVTGGEELAQIRTQVAAALDELVSSRGPRGAYKKAIEQRDEIKNALSDAEARHRETEQRMTRLADAVAKQQELSDPQQAGDRAALVKQSGSARDEALKARQEKKTAELERDKAGVVLEKATVEHQEFIGKIESCLQLQQSLVADRQRMSKISGEIAGQDKLLQDADATYNNTQLHLTEQQACFDRFHRAAAIAGKRKQLVDVLQAIQSAQFVATEMSALEVQLTDNLATDERFALAKRSHEALATLKTRLEQSAPRLTVAYEPGVENALQISGQTLGDGEIFAVEEPIDIVIEGIGRLTIDPRLSDDVEEDRRTLGHETEELDKSLKAMKMGSFEAARSAHDQRRDLAQLLDHARDRLGLIAPKGVDDLRRQYDRLDAEIESHGDIDGDAEHNLDIAELERELAAGRQKVGEQQSHRDALREQINKLRLEVAGLDGVIQQNDGRYAALLEAVGEAGERDERLGTLTAAVKAAEEKHNEFILEARAWAAKAPVETDFEKLQRDYDRAVDASKRAEIELTGLEKEIARLEGELSDGRRIGFGEQVARLTDQFKTASAAVEILADEEKTLRLLADNLDAVAEESRTAYLQPIAARLKPYFDIVFPGSDLSFADGFGVSGLTRAGLDEELVRLSDGTQEQISVLVRLGFARLLADRGRPLPLILDDALVYSDDERIERVFHALNEAACHHQVIALSCRVRSFHSLGGQQLRIEPTSWQDLG